jgi:SAM-dependent methyltransferase
MLFFIAFAATVTAVIVFLHWYSYRNLKHSIVRRQTWDLNISCGRIDGGGINADIVKHDDVPNFVLLENIYRLPFPDGAFQTVLCSHTVEHLEYPQRFDRELRRVGKEVTYVLPPIWDLAAALNIWEHKWLILSARKVHRKLPPRIPLPFARKLQARIGQRISA